MAGQVRVALELDVPRGEHRERLLDALGNLVRRRGYETFVGAPILLPRSEYFPERWEPSVAGARRLLRRLMHYAGLRELEVVLESWRERPHSAGGVSVEHTNNHAAAWFSGIHDGTCEFGLELEQLRHEGSLVASLGHEVAHAYRDHHDLVIVDRELEEKLTDITCVYLGFGVFTLNASHVVETGGFSASGEKLLYQTLSLGYLAPAEFALLVAAQLAVRGDASELRAVLNDLSPNHAVLVQGAFHDFIEDVAGLRRRLSVPEPSAWPSRPVLGQLDALADDDAMPEQVGPAQDDPGAQNDAIVFRVRRNRAVGVGALLLGASAIAGVTVGARTYAFYGLCALGATFGAVLGRRLRADECSGCRARLALDDERCPGCDGRISGEIASHDDRLDAEERLGPARDASEPGPTDEGEDPLAVLFTAMLAAWGLSRGLLSKDALAEHEELARRVLQLDFDTDALYSAWISAPLLEDEAMDFADYYCGEAASVRAQDFEILSTANKLDDRPANYQRFAVILDRRFADWKARSSEIAAQGTL